MRVGDGLGRVVQWCDAERCMVVDAITGEPERVDGRAICRLEDALAYVERRIWSDGLVILRLSAIVPAVIEQGGP